MDLNKKCQIVFGYPIRQQILGLGESWLSDYIRIKFTGDYEMPRESNEPPENIEDDIYDMAIASLSSGGSFRYVHFPPKFVLTIYYPQGILECESFAIQILHNTVLHSADLEQHNVEMNEIWVYIPDQKRFIKFSETTLTSQQIYNEYL